MEDYMEEYGKKDLISKKGDYDLIEKDVARISSEVQSILPDFPRPGVNTEEEYEGEKPFICTGGWHSEGDVYFTDAPRKDTGFPRHRASIHETAHAVGHYIKNEIMPSFTEIFSVLDKEELEEINEFKGDNLDALNDYGELRSQLSSGHFAVGFEHALRNELGLSTEGIEYEKKYADAEDGCEDTERNYFWNEEDEESLRGFLETALDEASQKRKKFFEKLPETKIEKLNYSDPVEIMEKYS